MSFDRYFKLSSYCLIIAGFIAIAATGAVDAFSLVLFSIALLVSWLIDTEKLRRRISSRLMNSLALAYLPIYLIDYLALSSSFAVSTIRLIFYAAALKLMTRSTDRDYVYLYLVSFAQLLAASTLTIDLTFALSLLMFLLAGTTTLVLFEMRRSNARAQSQGGVFPLVVPREARGTGLELFSSFPAASVSLISLVMTVTILLLAMPIFFLMPRIATGFYARPAGNTQMVSGFSEEVTLGEIGTIKESDRVVMRVRLRESQPSSSSNLKWRGIALDYYDGRSWRRSDLARTTLRPQEGYFKVEQSAQSTHLLTQTYFLEALSTDVIFASRRVLALSNELGSLRRDSFDNFFTAPHRSHKIRYTAVSDITHADPSLIPATLPPISESMRKTFLQLPSLDPRIVELAKNTTKSIPSSFGKAQALERFLKVNYGYSLQLKGTPRSADPLAMFLFDVRMGHCEYFASAMTIMLRQLAVPARLVNGFRAGEYNRFGDAWIVRQYDAHSWVEAYFPPYGWIEFDPTPPDPEHPKRAFLRTVSNLLDAADLWWMEDIVTYTSRSQGQMLRDARQTVWEYTLSLRNLGRSQISRWHMRMWLSSNGTGLAALVFLGGILILLIRYRVQCRNWIRRWLRKTALRGNVASAITSLYVEALDLLRSEGITRSPNQTPLELAQGLRSHPASAPFTALTQVYNRIRFGVPEKNVDLSYAEELLKTLKNHLRHRRTAASHLTRRS
jgi:protein-glutamine gamma-glutamyltransferase